MNNLTGSILILFATTTSVAAQNLYIADWQSYGVNPEELTQMLPSLRDFTRKLTPTQPMVTPSNGATTFTLNQQQMLRDWRTTSITSSTRKHLIIPTWCTVANYNILQLQLIDVSSAYLFKLYTPH